MSLLTSAVYPALEQPAGPAERGATYTLTHTGVGWTLLTRHRVGTLPGWSTPLAPHGAGPDATPRVAQAVAVRVLHELDVEVDGWSPADVGFDGPVPDVVARTSGRVAARLRGPRGLRGH